MKIQITEGTFDQTCTTENDLIQNQIVYPEISDVMQYAEQRMITTLIVSGAKNPYQTEVGDTSVKTKIGKIPDDKLIGNAGYRYRVMGRIQKSTEINYQVGTSGSDGTFSLSMKENYLVPGMNAVFHGNRLEARVMSSPTGTAGNYIYEFQTNDGTVFDWDTHVSPQSGAKTCFGGYTTYGEKSLRGYDRSHFPDMFINHTTIQRKSVSITGSASSTVLWIEFKGVKGWYHEKLRQSRVRFLLEDEHAKIWGKSNMRNTDGTLRATSRQYDRETGMEIVKGDGLWEQISGVNDAYTSGTNGEATYDDFADMMNTLKKKANTTSGNLWYSITGPDGMSNAQRVLENRATNNLNLTINKDGSTKIGGPDIQVGYNFYTLNVDGNQTIFCEHPLMGDTERWTELADDGTPLMSGSFIFLNMAGDENKRNIEILGRGAYGANRTMVSASLRGLTGAFNKLNIPVVSSVDADETHMLKEDGIFIYNTRACGILHRSRS